MALDTSMYGNLLGRPARSIDDWTNHFQAQDDNKQQRAMNALALQLKQGELEQARQTQTDQNTLRTLLANLQDRTPEGQIKALEGSGLTLGLSQAQAMRKDLAAQQKQASDLATAEATRQKTVQEVRQKAKQFAIQALQAAQTPEQAEAYVNAGVQQGAWGMNEATMLVQQMRSDPRGYETWRRDQLRQILDADKQLPKMETRDAGGTVQTLRMDPVLGTVGVANSVAKTATPGEIMTDKRARAQEDRMWAQFNYQKGRDSQSDAEKKAGLPPGGKPEKPLTESQAKAASFLGQMMAAEETLSQLKPNQTDWKEQTNVAMAGTAANVLASPKAQQVRQAQEQWAEAFLRYKTGAAATESEVKRNVRTFFPQFGDDQATIDQKSRMRQQAVADMSVSAGPGASKVEVVPSIKDRSAPAKGAPKAGDVQDGYRFKGGNPGDPKSWEKM